MAKKNNKTKKELEETNEFLRSMLRAFNDIKHGRIRDFKFSRYK